MARSDETGPEHQTRRTPHARSRASSSRCPKRRRYADHPHITLLAPFRPRDRLDDPALRRRARSVLREGRALGVRAGAGPQVPGRTSSISRPSPREPFRAMTLALAASFPTVRRTAACSTTSSRISRSTTARRPIPLPIDAHATVAHLVH